ncbi:hypothetical protein AKJ40_01360 [candidate division MSBL1 archaeon SCGC-AAA259M10]|uniref:Uncharacterized protein n=1 Tax=candidate division MSBL1 archaeon SCGC-AAA259M10 TaxID=1698270 RepID=A0A133V1V0_9EURY|nr:hypothetical protein AKJ40_01360 [candidate division MSBL1 archaeon SCGC-AAA259M10]
MKEEHRKQVRKATLKSKEILEKDIGNQLKKLGIYPDRRTSPEKLNLPVEKIQKRERILEVLDKLKQRELGDKTPQQFYTGEVAYTYFNRIIAIYLMEKRELLSNVLEPDPEFGNKPEQLWHFEKITNIHQRDTLYQTYFNSVFNEINEEIKKVFDTEDENSVLFPSANAIDEILGQLIEKIPDEAWKEEERRKKKEERNALCI